jgi:hypothetical protein
MLQCSWHACGESTRAIGRSPFELMPAMADGAISPIDHVNPNQPNWVHAAPQTISTAPMSTKNYVVDCVQASCQRLCGIC